MGAVVGAGQVRRYYDRREGRPVEARSYSTRQGSSIPRTSSWARAETIVRHARLTRCVLTSSAPRDERRGQPAARFLREPGVNISPIPVLLVK